MTENEHAEHPPAKALVCIGLFVALWLVISLVILGAFGIKQGWPAFLTLPLFFLAGADQKQLGNVFVGGAVGLLMSAAVAPVVGFLAKSGLGLQLAILLTIFMVVFLIVALGGTIPLVFNNFNLVYFTVAIVFPQQQTISWLATLILGGAFFTGGTLLFVLKGLPKLMAPKAQ